jgi:hypothetical protein
MNVQDIRGVRGAPVSARRIFPFVIVQDIRGARNAREVNWVDDGDSRATVISVALRSFLFLKSREGGDKGAGKGGLNTHSDRL